MWQADSSKGLRTSVRADSSHSFSFCCSGQTWLRRPVPLAPAKPLACVTWTQGIHSLSIWPSAWHLMINEHWIYLNQLCVLGQLILCPWASFHHLFCQERDLELDALRKVPSAPKLSSSTCESHFLIASSHQLLLPPPPPPPHPKDNYQHGPGLGYASSYKKQNSSPVFISFASKTIIVVSIWLFVDVQEVPKTTFRFKIL